jgi:hypothetical protein
MDLSSLPGLLRAREGLKSAGRSVLDAILPPLCLRCRVPVGPVVRPMRDPLSPRAGSGGALRGLPCTAEGVRAPAFGDRL